MVCTAGDLSSPPPAPLLHDCHASPSFRFSSPQAATAFALHLHGQGTRCQRETPPHCCDLGRRHGVLRHRLLWQRNRHAKPRRVGCRWTAVYAVLQHGPLLSHTSGLADWFVLASSGYRTHEWRLRGVCSRDGSLHWHADQWPPIAWAV